MGISDPTDWGARHTETREDHMDQTEPTPATEEADRAEAESSHVADRAPTAEEERLADDSRKRYEEDADSVAEHERSMNETGAEEKGEGRIG